MSGDSFIDSNVWLYAFMDESSPKQALAKALIEQKNIVLSTQVVNEVCNNLIRKASYTESEIQQTIQSLAAAYPILDVTLPIIQQASMLRVAYRLSYWDSLILATAQDAGCSVVYSEDIQDGLKVGGLTLRNPFKA